VAAPAEQTLSSTLIATPYLAVGFSLIPEINDILRLCILAIGVVTAYIVMRIKWRQWKHPRDFTDTGTFRIRKRDDLE